MATSPEDYQVMASQRNRRHSVFIAQSGTTFCAGEIRNLKALPLFLGLSPLAILIFPFEESMPSRWRARHQVPFSSVVMLHSALCIC